VKRSTRARNAAAPQEKKLFTERLKSNGKWVFLALAIVFSASFVLFGVGSSNSVGLQDILNAAGGGNNNAATTDSVSSGDLKDALAASTASPNDSAAWVRLGRAYQATAADQTTAKQDKAAEASYAKAVEAFVKASSLKKNDNDILKGLAAAYAAQASALQTQVTALQDQANLVQAGSSPTATLLPSGLNSPDAVSQAQDAIISQQVTAIQKQITPLQNASEKATEDAYKTWKSLTVLNPKDAATWFEFANAAVNAAQGVSLATVDVQTEKNDAITGFKKFLELAPGDPLAPQVQAAVDQLEGKTSTTATATAPSSTAAASGSTSTSP
jgi:tetratricopeptide (TPR) repeat protein